MQKCRLCLSNSKHLKCIFEISHKGLIYAEIINSITNVKVCKSDGITDQICLSCRRKTKEVWEFRLQVERSYMALQENCPTKRVYFTNIYDVKLKSEVIDEDFKKPMPLDISKNLVNNNHVPFNYNDTVIKKVSSDEKKSLSVIDFLDSIKEKSEDNFQDSTYEVQVDYDLDLAANPDYKFQSLPKKIYKMYSTKNQERKKYLRVLEKPIKPVFLADYKLVPTKNPKKLKVKKDKMLICPYCGKIFKDKYLKVHLLTHSDEKPFKCLKCARAFVREGQLNSHVASAHGSRVVKCDLCVASFTTKDRLISHIRNRHSAEKNHICEVCSKGFKMRTHLARHVRTVHSLGPKPFQCERCPDAFSSSHALKHHLRVHTLERPYNCQLCSQPYSYKHDFNRHCLNKHGVCFKRRTVHVMNGEVLAQERALMRDLTLRVNGVLKDDKPINPFEGPQAALAFDQVLKAIQSGKVVVDLQI